MVLLYLFLVVVAVKMLLNYLRYASCKRYMRQYRQWLENRLSPNRDENEGWRLVERKSDIVKLLKNAGVSDSYVPITQEVGYGYISSSNASVMDNFPRAEQDFAAIILRMFHESIGFYRARMWEALSPRYWIEFIIFLPKQIADYLGIASGGIGIKLLQVLWWAIGIAFTILLSVYTPEVSIVIRSWISSFMPR